jgi:hypothetical protein
MCSPVILAAATLACSNPTPWTRHVLGGTVLPMGNPHATTVTGRRAPLLPGVVEVRMPHEDGLIAFLETLGEVW